MKKYVKFSVPIIFTILLYSCASVAPPKGGEKDNTKPRVVKTLPKNGTTNFKGKSIKYYFSEWIQEEKLRNNIIITPRVQDFESKVVKNVLILQFDSSAFKPNTTYNINLRQGIKDLNEGIHSDSTNLVFSTGSYLDSLSIKGTVVSGVDNKKGKDITIALYEPADTFSIEKAIPVYSTKTDTLAQYSIENIKPGKYIFYAYGDENNNNRFDKGKEQIGYLKDTIKLNNSLSISSINSFTEIHEKPKIIFKENKKRGKAKVEYNREIKRLTAKSLGTNRTIYVTVKEKQVLLTTDNATTDSAKVVLTATDELGNTGSDTLGFILNYTDTTKCSYTFIPSAGSQIEPTDSLILTLSQPYSSFTNNIRIYNGKKEYINPTEKDGFMIKQIPVFNSLSIRNKNKWSDTVAVHVYPTAFKPVNGYLKDTIKAAFTLKDAEKYGTIGGLVTTDHNNLIIELLTKDNKVLKQIRNKKEFLFEYLPDGEYRIRVITDANNNNKWDQGDYRTLKLPEEIHHYPETIKLKSSWEILDLKISF